MRSRLPDQLTERALVVAMSLVLYPATLLAFALLASWWLAVYSLALVPIMVVCGALMIDAVKRISHPERPWSWADLALGIVVVSAGAVGWVMAWRASVDDMDTNRLVVFALAALWLTAVATATASIARSLMTPAAAS